MSAQMILKKSLGENGISWLSSKLGISKQAIYNWKKVPAERVLTIEKLTGISRHEMRPDIYGGKRAK